MIKNKFKKIKTSFFSLQGLGWPNLKDFKGKLDIEDKLVNSNLTHRMEIFWVQGQ